MNSFYEHHFSIRKNKLCPFLLSHAVSTTAVPCNWHKNIEILLITEGEGTFQYSAETVPIMAGDIIIVNSNVIHRPYSETGVGYYYLIIDEHFCSENGIDVTRYVFDKKLRCAQVKQKLDAVVASMKAYEQDTADLSVAALRSAVLSLLVDICVNHATPSGENNPQASASEEYVKRVLEYVNKNYAESICLESLAELCGITKFHLAREFKKHTGQTVFSYLNSLRCKNAEFCISRGMSITEAAYANGFDSLSYFSRTYKKKMGKAPSKAK